MSGVTRSDLNNIAQSISDSRVALDQLINELGPHVWSGPDADSFRSRWQTEISTALLTHERTTRNMTIQTYQGQ